MGFWVFFTDDKLEYYDSDDCALYLSSNRVVEIVSNDKTIFDFLISHRNQPMTRLQIQKQIYSWTDINDGDNKDADRGPIDQAISKLRGTLGNYRWCIKTVRGHGYKYIGPEKVDKDTADAIPNKEKSQGKPTEEYKSEINTPIVSFDFSKSKDLAYLRKVERAKRIMTDLNEALELMKEATSVNDFQKARFQIVRAIEKCPSYAEIILATYRDEEEGELLENGWDEISDKLKRKLILLIEHYNALVEKDLSEIGEIDSDLALIKLDFLLYLQDWHLTVAFLEETLKREQEGLRLAESQIQKEYLQRNIRYTESRLEYSHQGDKEDDMKIDDRVDAYRLSVANNITSV